MTRKTPAIIASTVISPTMILSPSEYLRGWKLVFGSYAGSDGNEIVIDFDCDSYDGVGTYRIVVQCAGRIGQLAYCTLSCIPSPVIIRFLGIGGSKKIDA